MTLTPGGQQFGLVSSSGLVNSTFECSGVRNLNPKLAKRPTKSGTENL
jgi:hypothetical protein